MLEAITHNHFRDYSTAQVDHLKKFTPGEKVRFLTATALFDGHDASINIMRRLLQQRGAEVIHLGHNRTAKEVVHAAICEDVHGVALSSYQGGHVEFFSYIRKLLNELGGEDILIFGGGGGVITLEEIANLEAVGVTKIYSPEDGQCLGLDGIIGHMLFCSDKKMTTWQKKPSQYSFWGRGLTLLENGGATFEQVENLLEKNKKTTPLKKPPILGVTGTGGAGKSSLVDELLHRFLVDFEDIKIAVICVDPSKKKTGGALLGDRLRMNACSDERIFLRSFASRQSGKELAQICQNAVQLLSRSDFDLIIVETSGIGQGDTGILELSDISLYVMTPEYGASTQLEKIDMLDFADFIAINKVERRQGPDAFRDVKTLLRRSRYKGVEQPENKYPVFGTIASRFNDDGVSALYQAIVYELSSHNKKINPKSLKKRPVSQLSSKRESLIVPEREHYLSHISEKVRRYHKTTRELLESVSSWEALGKTMNLLSAKSHQDLHGVLKKKREQLEKKIGADFLKELQDWPEVKKQYLADEYTYKVRGRDLSVESSFETLSHLKIPKVCLPKTDSLLEAARYMRNENRPGFFPFVGGLFPFRRQGEDPQRQFAGEGGPHRTNKRFHYLASDQGSTRLSTAFDSVTLYGDEPQKRPDIYGKIGESGVSIAHLEDMKALYDGFNLCHPTTSVSMTINGPAPIILAMFLNTAIDQELDSFKEQKGRVPTPKEHQEIFDETLKKVRGTVQADILKEDQAQNTCIFSTEFALKMMADMQEYFIKKSVRNYYGVSISGYHIAEAGANPISQLAFTLSNGFTYVEYYLSRGMKIDDFAPNLSFFFSNGIDAEYSVLGRVARRIWAIAMRDYYHGNERSQKLKYHIQTSGRSLHAQEIDFNDIRTTLQALMALNDNCNSLHTNAYDEALTTPTEDSVRRAMAIQLIINKELGSSKCENLNQGSHFIDHLTDLVEEAVLQEFERISHRGGVLGAMETQYQRSKIQEESLYYEFLKDRGTLPIIGVNTFLKDNGKGSEINRESTDLIRASYNEKDDQLKRLNHFKQDHQSRKKEALKELVDVVIADGNIFAQLMDTVRYCSLGEITDTLYEVGGRYRRSV